MSLWTVFFYIKYLVPLSDGYPRERNAITAVIYRRHVSGTWQVTINAVTVYIKCYFACRRANVLDNDMLQLIINVDSFAKLLPIIACSFWRHSRNTNNIQGCKSVWIYSSRGDFIILMQLGDEFPFCFVLVSRGAAISKNTQFSHAMVFEFREIVR